MLVRGTRTCTDRLQGLMQRNSTVRAVASLGGTGGRTAQGDTLQGVTPEGKTVFGKFTKNSGETRSDR